MAYLLHIAIIVLIYSILAISLDLLVGQLGIFSVAHAAFFGIGAYVVALLSIHSGVPFGWSLLAGMLLAAVVSLLLAFPGLLLRDDYLAIVTFGFGIILFNIFNNWASVTRGPMGIPGIPKPEFFGMRIHTQWQFVALAGLAASFAYLVVWRITASPFGRVLRAVREDDFFPQSLGKNTLRFKIVAFAVSAALAAVAGGLYAAYVSYIDPMSFTMMDSILVISMVIVGGAGNPRGSLLGAAVVIALPELLRFVGLPSPVAANLRQLFYSVLLVLMMMFRPRGLVGSYGFSR